MKLPEFWKTYAAVLLAALGIYVWIVESKKPEGADAKPKEKVFTLDKAKVGELTIAPAEGETVKLVREGTGWKMTAPSAVSADPAAVDSMIASLESLEIDEVVADNATNLADFGLDKPLYEQYLIYLWNIAHLDFGFSMASYPMRVSTLMAGALPWTLISSRPARASRSA